MSESSLRALIIEDDVSWQQILSEILRDMGLAVDLASTMDEAIASLRATPHRLAVVDLSLEESNHLNQDGLQALDAVKHYDPGCAAIMLTGFATVEIAVSALTEHGAYTCLRKEAFRRSEFRQLVQQALSVAPPLPSAPAAGGSATPQPGQAPDATGPAQRRVLVVEDDAGWRSILGELLADMGHRVALSASYGEALGRLRRQRYDLAVVDLRLASSTAPDGNQDGYRVRLILVPLPFLPSSLAGQRSRWISNVPTPSTASEPAWKSKLSTAPLSAARLRNRWPAGARVMRT